MWHVREFLVAGHLGLRRAFLRKLLQRVPAATVFLSQADLHAAGDVAGAHVIPNGTRFEDVPPSIRRQRRGKARSELGLDDAEPVVLFLGGTSSIKGAAVLQAALPLLQARIPGVRTIIAGMGEQSKSWRGRTYRAVVHLAGQRTYDERVRDSMEAAGSAQVVQPFVDDPSVLFDAADVLVFPATEPHFPRPVIEAFAHRTPVVVSDLPGAGELVRHDHNGLLVPPGNAAALAAALERVLRDDALASRLSTTAFDEGRLQYDESVVATALGNVLEQAAGNR